MPVSVSGGTVNADGSITVTGARLNLDGLLTQAAVVRIEGVVSIASNQILFGRLRASGADVTTNHAQQLMYGANGTGGGNALSVQNPAATNANWQLGAQPGSWHHFILTLFGAGQATPTIGGLDLDEYGSLTAMSKVSSSLFQADQAPRDGLAIAAGTIAGANAMSGTVRCYAVA